MIENGQVTVPANSELINELKSNGYKISANGNVQYGAPEGYHDDCVVALALAAWQLKRSPPLEGPGIAVIRKKPVYRDEDDD